jgi:hypothetical protein
MLNSNKSFLFTLMELRFSVWHKTERFTIQGNHWGSIVFPSQLEYWTHRDNQDSFALKSKFQTRP